MVYIETHGKANAKKCHLSKAFEIDNRNPLRLHGLKYQR